MDTVFTEPATPGPLVGDAFQRPQPTSPRITRQQRDMLERAKRQLCFLDDYALHGVIGRACKAAKISRRQVDEWRRTDEAFAMLMAEAMANAIDLVEYELHRRAVEGLDLPTTVAGEREVIKKYSDSLLVLRLKALKPAVYDRQPERGGNVTVNAHQTNNLVVPIERLSDEQFRLLEQIYGAAGPQLVDVPSPPAITDGRE
jgi:hypothetical protein